MDDPQPDMSDGKAYAAWCMRQSLRKEKAKTVSVSAPEYTIETVPTESEDPRPLNGVGYGMWCARQGLRKQRRAIYGTEDHIHRSRKTLVQQAIGYLYGLSERKLNDAFGSLHGEMDQEAWDAWLEHHPELKRLIGTDG